MKGGDQSSATGCVCTKSTAPLGLGMEEESSELLSSSCSSEPPGLSRAGADALRGFARTDPSSERLREHKVQNAARPEGNARPALFKELNDLFQRLRSSRSPRAAPRPRQSRLRQGPMFVSGEPAAGDGPGREEFMVAQTRRGKEEAKTTVCIVFAQPRVSRSVWTEPQSVRG